MRLTFVYLLGLSAMCLGSPVTPARASSEWIVARMGNGFLAEVTWEQIRHQVLATFYHSNPDERGVTMQGIDNLRRITAAQRRSQVIAQILNYDLDGNGSVTKQEITAAIEPRARQMLNANGVQLEPTLQQVRLQLDKLVAEALKPDTDRDGVITPAEIEQEAKTLADQATSGWRERASSQFIPMTLDTNGDGAVSLAEFEAAVREQFDAVDRDRDGRISAAEATDFRKRLQEARLATQHAQETQAKRLKLEAAKVGCDVPATPPGMKTLLLGAVQGNCRTPGSVPRIRWRM
jgi:EF hand